MIVLSVKGAALAGLLVPVVAGFPHVDVGRLCAKAGVFGPTDKARAVCFRQENEAREKLQALWPKLQVSDRAVCLGDAETGIDESYTSIVGCIETSQELRREKSLPARTSIPPH